ncbi:MAG: PaaI family thioesterase [Alphaproteobacteria bacterium]|nr:PaaI family thioesterase [Alphaproteobacteria bacterium]
MPEDIADKIRRYLSSGAFQKFLGIELVSCDAQAGAVEMRLPWKAEFERGPGTKQWHGGPMAALIDIVGDFALIAMLGRALPTINLRIDYLRPAIDTDLFASARTLRAGKSVGFVDIELKDKTGRVVAVGRGAYSTLPPQP